MASFDVFDQLEIELNTTRTTHITHTTNETHNETQCKHVNTTNEHGIVNCLDCGYEIRNGISNESKMYTSYDNRSSGDGNRCWAPKKKNKSIRDDLKGLGFPDPVINEADSIFKTVTKGGIFRVDKRKSIIVACLMEAYKILGEKVSLESLLEKIPITNVTIGMKIVETKIKKYDTDRKRIIHTSPADSIRDILSKWETDKQTIDKVVELYHCIDDKSSLINRSRARSVAAAVIYYYALATNRDNIKLKEFSAKVKLSESTITKLAKEISAILATPEILLYS